MHSRHACFSAATGNEVRRSDNALVLLLSPHACVSPPASLHLQCFQANAVARKVVGSLIHKGPPV